MYEHFNDQCHRKVLNGYSLLRITSVVKYCIKCPSISNPWAFQSVPNKESQRELNCFILMYWISKRGWRLFTVNTIWNIGETGDINCSYHKNFKIVNIIYFRLNVNYNCKWLNWTGSNTIPTLWLLLKNAEGFTICFPGKSIGTNFFTVHKPI